MQNIRRLFTLRKVNTLLWGKVILNTGVPILVYICILSVPFPYEIGLAFRYDFGVILVILFALLLPIYSIKNWLGFPLRLLFTLGIFALPLSGLWRSGVSEPNVLLGLIPWSDANGYYHDAKALIEGQLFSEFSAKRPLYTGFLSALLNLTKQNLQVALAIQVALVAIACYFLTREIQRTHGTLSSVVVIILLFFFYRRFIGTTLTENAGLLLGVLALGFLWRGAFEKNRWIVVAGLFITSLALNARAGAFLILPILIFWAGRTFRNKGWLSYRMILLGIIVCGLGFSITTIEFNTLTNQTGETFYNYAYTLYGQAVGGKGWEQYKIDHPEILKLSSAERAHRLYELSFEAIRSDPSKIISASIKSCLDLFISQPNNVYTSVSGDNERINLVVRVILFIMGGITIIIWIRKKEDINLSLVMVGLAGVILSAPLVPPGDSDRMRAYAATFPYIAVWPALGVSLLVSKIKSIKFLTDQQEMTFPHLLPGFSICVIAFTILGPFLVRLFSTSLKPDQINCPAGQKAVYTRQLAGNSVVINDKKDPSQAWNPIISSVQFQKSLHDFMYTDVMLELIDVKTPVAISSVFDIKSHREITMVIDEPSMSFSNGVKGFCGNWSANGGEKMSRFFYASSSLDIPKTP